MGVLEVAEPASEHRVEIGEDTRQALPARSPGLRPNAVLEPGQALLADMTPAGFEAVAEEVEALPRLPAVAEVGLVRMQTQAVGGGPAADRRQRRLGLFAACTEHHEVVCIAHHPMACCRHQRVQRVEVDVRQQRADHRTLRRARRRRPAFHVPQHLLPEPAAQQIEHAAIADPRLDPLHQPLVRNAVEVAREIGIDHIGVALLDQTVYFAERVMAAAPRPEAVAPGMEASLENRFDHELHRRLHDPVLDHRDAQRPEPAIALGDLHPLDRLRTVAPLAQRRHQLGQIILCPGREPLDAHTIHAGRALVGPDTRPGRRKRRRRSHLIHQAVPTSSFDAVVQRRQHAFRPHRGFHPGPVARPTPGFCTTFSRFCTAAALLPPSGHRASTFLPPFPRPGFALRASHGPDQRHGRRGTMRALKPAGLATNRQVSPLTPSCLPSIPPPNTSCLRTSLSQSPQRARPDPNCDPGFAMSRQARQVMPPKRVRHPAGCSFAAGCSPPRLTATQLPLASCNVTSHDKDPHLADKT